MSLGPCIYSSCYDQLAVTLPLVCMQFRESLLIDLTAGVSIGFMVVPQGTVSALLCTVWCHMDAVPTYLT